MKFGKNISLLLIGSCLIGFSTFANAGDLKISNDSKYELSFGINKVCSTEFGTVDAASITVIPAASLAKACAYNLTSCETKVYDAPSCSGKQVATIIFDTTGWGVESIIPSGITVKGNGFNLFFEGPWLAK
jgi:hypothetical protein